MTKYGAITLKRATTKHISIEQRTVLTTALQMAHERWLKDADMFRKVDKDSGFISVKAAKKMAEHFSRQAVTCMALLEQTNEAIDILFDFNED